jgi:hypothetical protein
MMYDGKVLFTQKPNFYGMAFDGGPEVESIGKARYWTGTIDLNKL